MDEHGVPVDAPREAVREAVERYADRLARSQHALVGTVLGTEPRSGFEISRKIEGERLEMSGRHRFSRYRVAFALAEQPDGALRLSATSYAEFPGVHGKLYRTLLLRTGAHIWAVRRMLRAISRRASGEGERRKGE
jgi:hypothetical protein